MKYNLYDMELEYSVEQENYNLIVSNFRKFEREVKRTFCRRFREKFSNIEDVMENIFDLCREYTNPALDWVLGFLASNGIYDYDSTRLSDYFHKTHKTSEPWISVLMEVEAKYDLIVSEVEEAREYRAERKASRNRVEGYGYLESEVAAGAANLALLEYTLAFYQDIIAWKHRMRSETYGKEKSIHIHQSIDDDAGRWFFIGGTAK